MFSYYGSKTNIVKLYPKPKYKIIEAFAGAGKYAYEYFDNEVLLVDKYEVIVRIWKWLQQCSPNDVLKLPRPQLGQTLNDFTFDCEEAKLFMGFVVQYGVARPGITPSAMKINPAKGAKSRGNFMNYTLGRIAKDLYKIKHWKIMHGSYVDLPNEKATWFIDPPYKFGGHKYVHSNKEIDYVHLADWLPFTPMVQHQGGQKYQHEAIWTNEPTQYNNKQLDVYNILF